MDKKKVGIEKCPDKYATIEMKVDVRILKEMDTLKDNSNNNGMSFGEKAMPALKNSSNVASKSSYKIRDGSVPKI